MEQIYICINKPAGVVCKAEADRHKTVFQLLSPDLQTLVKGAKRGQRLHTVGRLDLDTTGLLIITTDGVLSHNLTAPENKISKTYNAALTSPVPPPQQKTYISRAAEGLLLPADKKAPEQMSSGAQLSFITESLCQVTLTEGKFHEVKRLFKALGNEVIQLERSAMGQLTLEHCNLNQGQFRPLTKEELSLLLNAE